MPTASNAGVKIHWESEGEGTPILLVMGHLFSGRMWWPLLPGLAAKHRVIWFDNRGTGESDSTDDATVDDLVGDAVAVLDAAGVTEPAHVFGVSMGGIVSHNLAINHADRVKSLVLGCTSIATDKMPKRPPGANVVYYLPAWVRTPAMKTALYGKKTPPDVLKRELEMLKGEVFSPKGVIAQGKAVSAYVPSMAAISAIDKPTLVMHGTKDKAVPFAHGQQIADTIPGARLSTYADGAHCFYLMDLERTKTELLDFFASAES